MELLFYFLLSLAAILLSCIVFSNSIEWLGVRLNLSHGVTGSILAAVGTALPETIVPLVAIFWGINQETLVKILSGKIETLNSINQISMGAIIGAPFMLSTIAFFLIGVSSWLYFKTGRRKKNQINADKTVLERDLTFFLISFFIAFIAIFLNHFMHVVLAFLMIFIYVLYVYLTVNEEKDNNYKGEHLMENLDPFILSRLLPFLKTTLFLIYFQLFVSLICLIYSAHFFVEVIKEVSTHFSFSPFVISLLLTPLATELPEKFNSWMWIRQNKDTLALGNVTGALVFQSTFQVALGLILTSWQAFSSISYVVFVFSLLSGAIVLFALKKDKLSYKVFLLGGVLYLVYLIIVLVQFR